jgi:hypothetical protein
MQRVERVVGERRSLERVGSDYAKRGLVALQGVRGVGRALRNLHDARFAIDLRCRNRDARIDVAHDGHHAVVNELLRDLRAGAWVGGIVLGVELEPYWLSADHGMLAVDLVNSQPGRVLAVLTHVGELPGQRRGVTNQDYGGIGGEAGCAYRQENRGGHGGASGKRET